MIEPIVALRSERLDLEPLRLDHAGEMASVLADPRLYTFIGGHPPDARQLRERYRHQLVGGSADGTQQWFNWVIRRRDDGRALGYVQATVTEDADGPAAEVAWVVGTGFQGRGFAREAAGAMADWLRHQGVSRVVAHVHPEHPASQAVARAAGLVPTTTVVDGEVRWQSGSPADGAPHLEGPEPGAG